VLVDADQAELDEAVEDRVDRGLVHLERAGELDGRSGTTRAGEEDPVVQRQRCTYVDMSTFF
jgi:hypothetical protein